MSLTYVGAGVGSVSTVNLDPSYPSGLADGDLLILCVVNKYPTNGPPTPSGWTLLVQTSGGSGVAGANTGDVYVTVFTKVSDGTETGNESFSITSGNSSFAQMFAYRGQTASVDYGVGEDATAGLAWSVTTDTLSVRPNDIVLAVSGVNTNLGTWSSWSLAMTGVTFDTATQLESAGNTLGDNIGFELSEHPVLTGTATVAGTYTMTSDATAADYPAGATVLVRIRDAASTTADLWVEGVAEVIARDRWSVTFNTTPVVDVLPNGPFILDTSLLDSDDQLGY